MAFDHIGQIVGISSMARIDEAGILKVLGGVMDPDRGQDVVSLGMVKDLTVKDGNVFFSLEVDPARGPKLEPLRQAAEKAVFDLPGVASATVVLTAHRAKPTPPPAPAAKKGPAKEALPNIRSLVAVASGKGGVGKSTTATNLALALSRLGLKVGILDADIYGPSQPRLMGLKGRPQSPDGKKLIPLENFGIKVMSIGFLVAEDTPMIWRGPMVQSALMQMLRDVEWGELDCLVVDLPPGTGDAQLTMAQQVPLTGAVIVSTPQDLALLDAKKGVNMFRKVDVPILGLIENMSVFICPHCGGASHIFAHGGAKAEAEKQGVPFLGEVPLVMQIRESSDAGLPIVAAAPDSEAAKLYLEIARKVWAQTLAQLDGGSRHAPRIVME